MEEVKPTFDSDKAAVLVNELRKTFNSGKTKSYEWRISQLESISKMIDEKEKEIVEALHRDLSKPELEAFLSEVCILHFIINYHACVYCSLCLFFYITLQVSTLFIFNILPSAVNSLNKFFVCFHQLSSKIA